MMNGTDAAQSGRELVINVVQQRARDGHHRLYAHLPKGTTPAQGYIDVSYADLLKAIDRTAHFLDDHLGPASDVSTFAWIAHGCDLRYALFMFAAMKTGHRAFFPSPRNSMAAYKSLVHATDTKHLLVPKQGALPVTRQILKSLPVTEIVAPSVEDLLGITGSLLAREYPFHKTLDEVRFQPFAILHTSGSTGTPKPVIIKQGYLPCMDAYKQMPSHGAKDPFMVQTGNQTHFNVYPSFHIAGLLGRVCLNVYYDFTNIDAPLVPLTGDMALGFVQDPRVETAWLPCSTLRDIAAEPATLDKLSQVKFIFTGGAPLANDVVDKILKKTQLLNVYGQTESSMAPTQKCARNEFSYISFSEKLGTRFEHIVDDIYELIYYRVPELDNMQPVFITFPELQEYHTKDTFSRHPTDPELWLFRGRMDDVVVLENGEMFNPLDMQFEIEKDLRIDNALIAGTGHFQPCLLLELKKPLETETEKRDFISTLQPTIDAANSVAPQGYGRLDKSVVLIGSPDKPFSRTDKGTVKRRPTLELYKEEIEAFYVRLSSTSANGIAALDFSNPEKTKASVRLALSNAGFTVGSDSEDLFAHGLDSLQVLNISRYLGSESGSSLITPRLIYANPTVDKLASVISDSAVKAAVPILSREEQMEASLAEHSSNLPLNARKPLPRPSTNTIILTGSTGSLGSYMLHYLLTHDASAQIVCLNRSADASSRQKESHIAKGLATDFSRVTFTRSSTNSPYLGLPLDIYKTLLSTTTHILHNAWPVNFNQSLASFTPHVSFVRQLVDFAAHSSHGAHLYFISTIGTAAGIGAPRPSVPEKVLCDWHASAPMGYAESKHVSEVLLDRAAREAGVHATVCRVGQIAGPVGFGEHGAWNRQEWLPALIQSSVHLGLVPGDLASFDGVDWVPVDVVAESVVQLLLGAAVGAREHDHGAVDGEGDALLRVHHIVNRASVPWSKLLPAVLATLPEGKRPEVVPFSEWTARLEERAASLSSGAGVSNGTSHDADEAEVRASPALKILPHYIGMRDAAAMGVAAPSLETTRTVKDGAKALQACAEVNGSWIELWMRQWGF